ncbi:MAG: hypothetical protein FWH36_04125 [Lentimicrobiaceae bacterium]|nr:hypothetical protein [Lentimicrobiaceae bacterium]
MKLRTIFLGIALVFTAVLFSSCGGDVDYSKDNHLKTNEIMDSLYNEIFLVHSFGETERYSEYITDSVHFRKYICTHDFGEWIYGEILKDGFLVVYKVSGKVAGTQVILDTNKITTCNIGELKREGKFE